jgi:hypothetical protein
MKKFISENWYKLMIGSSLLMASFGFLVHSISPALADNSKDKMGLSSNYRLVPTNEDGSINVKLSDDQLMKIIPKNEDGSINVKMDPNAIVNVNIQQLSGSHVTHPWNPPPGIDPSECGLPVLISNR